MVTVMLSPLPVPRWGWRWMIFHSAKALRSGFFVGWYKGTYENYSIYRSETPIYFYWYNTVFSLFGSFMIGLALYLLNGDYHFL